MLFCDNSVFVTYGDEKFIQSRDRVIREAKRCGSFTDCILETEEMMYDKEFQVALKNKDFREVFSNPKGGGCYIWKPYVIYKNLSRLNTNDILVYGDAGCTVPDDQKSKDMMSKYFVALRDPKGVLGFRSHHIESEMAKGDVFEYFDAMNKEELHATPKFSAGRHFVRKCDHSMKIYDRWWSVAKSEPRLFDERWSSRAKNFPNFIRHVWDTGTWSMICKTMGAVDQPWTEEDIPIKGSRIRR